MIGVKYYRNSLHILHNESICMTPNWHLALFSGDAPCVPARVDARECQARFGSRLNLSISLRGKKKKLNIQKNKHGINTRSLQVSL